jgi:AcrR family transcriptional regulator
MPKVSEQHMAARRQQIIDAAYRCFARKGFHQATMRDIYAEAGLSPGAVYHYFDSKQAIIAASFDFDYARSSELFAAAAGADDPLRALLDLLDFLFQGLKGAAAVQAPAVNVQGFGEALVDPALGATVRRVLRIYGDTVTEIFRLAQARGDVAPELDARSLAQAVLSLYYGLELQLALNPALDVDSYSQAVKRLLQGTSRRD